MARSKLASAHGERPLRGPFFFALFALSLLLGGIHPGVMGVPGRDWLGLRRLVAFQEHSDSRATMVDRRLAPEEQVDEHDQKPRQRGGAEDQDQDRGVGERGDHCLRQVAICWWPPGVLKTTAPNT